MAGNSGLPYLTQETPQSSNWYSATVPNRIATWSYDANGNVLGVGGMARSFTYDAENRQVAANMNGAIGTYQYDGNGFRVSKIELGGVTKVYVYDAFGNVAAEYASQVDPSPCGTSTCYVTQDHLGSTRLLTDSTGWRSGGTTTSRSGRRSWPGTTGGRRGTCTCRRRTDTDPKFTGQDRDVETGLDWFQVCGT